MGFLNWLKSNKAQPRTEPVPSPGASPPDPRPDEIAPPPPPEQTISLELRPILKMFPLHLGQPTLRSVIDTDEEIALPFKLIQSQLSAGRVVVKAATLLDAMPEHIRIALGEIDSNAKIPIPLQEIFRNLPSDAIKLRDDQVIEHPDEIVPTPFTEKAQEDALRFAEPVEPTPPGVVVVPETDFTRLNSIFVTDEPLDLPAVLAKIAQLPAIQACVLTTGDGRIILGSLGNEKLDHAIQTLIPRLFDESKSKLSEQGISPLQTITYSCQDEQLSSFGQENVYLTVLHGQRPFKPGVREKIFRVLAELAKMKGQSFA
jgi:hypothetical protein